MWNYSVQLFFLGQKGFTVVGVKRCYRCITSLVLVEHWGDLNHCLGWLTSPHHIKQVTLWELISFKPICNYMWWQSSQECFNLWIETYKWQREGGRSRVLTGFNVALILIVHSVTALSFDFHGNFLFPAVTTVGFRFILRRFWNLDRSLWVDIDVWANKIYWYKTLGKQMWIH